MPGNVGAQPVVIGFARRLDRHGDTATSVGFARHAGGELGTAVARENQVRMTVHKTRNDGGAARVDTCVACGRSVRIADPGDRFTGHRDRSIMTDTCTVGAGR